MDQKITIFNNPDKDRFKGSWDDGRTCMLDFPIPYRCLIVGAPGTGKTLLVKNLIIGQDEKRTFERIYLWHPDTESTEYDDVECKKISEPPQIEEIDPKKRNLLIIDDMMLKNLRPDENARLDKLLSYTSTHRNLSVILTTQNYVSQMSVSLRRYCNIFIVFKSNDRGFIRDLGNKVGLNGRLVQNLFDKHIKEFHDFLVFDMTSRSPYPVRKNFYEVICIDNKEEKEEGEGLTANYCNICSKGFKNSLNYERHLNTKTHKNNKR